MPQAQLTKRHSLDCVVEEHSVLWHNSHSLPKAGLAVAFDVLPSKCDLSLHHVKHSDQQLGHSGLSASGAENVVVIQFFCDILSFQTFLRGQLLCQLQS